jgi:hypothetical protein
LSVHALVVAVVVFEEVDASGSEQVRVLDLVIQRARKPVGVAGLGTGARVDSELEALLVDIVRECLDALGEPLRIGYEVSFGVAFRQCPPSSMFTYW